MKSKKAKVNPHSDVFLSHRSTAKPFVRELAGHIECVRHNGGLLSAWVDEAEIRPGQSIPGLINQGLEQSRFFAPIITRDYFNSPSGWTDAEWHAALSVDPDNRKATRIRMDNRLGAMFFMNVQSGKTHLRYSD